jgi:ABC-type lipoprotein release transport system permease subunit
VGYRSALVTRWSRRDRLAVLVVAVTVAFLTGTTLLAVTAAGETAAMADGYGSEATVAHYGTLDAARAAAGPADAVLPLASVAVAAGGDQERATVVGLPDEPITVHAAGGPVSVAGAPASGVAREATPPARRVRLVGEAATVHARAGTRAADLLPPEWYAADRDAVARLGVTGALVVDAEPGGAGTPLVAVQSFVRGGFDQLLRALALAALAGAVLVAVTVYSVTRMLVRDRRRTVRVARATGATPRQVVGLFAARATAVAAVGVALGYGLGTVTTHAVVNAALYAGLPTTLTVRIGRTAGALLVGIGVGVVAVSAVAGALAALGAVRGPPARVGCRPRGRAGASARSRLAAARPVARLAGTRVLDWRALVPTTATLTVFVAFVLIVAGIGGVMAPLTAAETTTVTQPGAAHPIASSVPAGYAAALEAQGVEASPEILLFESVDGRPFLARGVDYAAYRDVTGVRLASGRAPAAPDEAVVGADLAAALDVGAGDTLALGGSTRPGLARVTVVGVFAGAGPRDDQLLVPLQTARHLAGLAPDAVQFVRASGRLETDAGGSPVRVFDVGDPARVDGGYAVAVTVRNHGLSRAERTFEIRFGEQTRTLAVDLPARRTRTERVRFAPPGASRVRLAVGEVDRTVRLNGTRIRIVGLPAPIPPGSRPQVTVATGDGAAANATLRAGDRTVRTDDAGRARLPPLAAGTHRLIAERGDARTATTVRVDERATRRLLVDAAVRPSTPTVATVPEVRVAVRNPWAERIERAVAVRGPSTAVTRRVALAPGASTERRVRLSRRPAGEYAVRVLAGNETLATATYRVRGDDRLGAALASSGRTTPGSGVGQAVEAAFGNLQVLLVGLVGLAGLMTVGGTTAAFAQSVHARRRTVGVRRATGASPARVARALLGDAIRVALAATLLALALASALVKGLVAVGELRAFGAALDPPLSAAVLAGAGAGALALALVSAGLATVALVSAAPARLLGDGERRIARGTTGERERSGETDA